MRGIGVLRHLQPYLVIYGGQFPQLENNLCTSHDIRTRTTAESGEYVQSETPWPRRPLNDRKGHI